MIYAYHEDKIKKALDEVGVNYDPNDVLDIQTKFIQSKEAQDIVGKQIIEKNIKAAKAVKAKYPEYNFNINKLIYLAHWLGPKGMEEYIDMSVQEGVDKADEIMTSKINKGIFKNSKISEGLKKFEERQRKFYES